MKQALDYLEEAQVLAQALEPLSEDKLNEPTLFKDWTINDVVGHLYMFDHAAMISLNEPKKFDAFLEPLSRGLSEGKTFLQMQQPWLGDLTGRALFDTWRDGSVKMAKAYEVADPKARLAWAGPSMSARSSITARQMETWAHGHEVFDALGLQREENDRIYNICHMGVATFGWAFINRKMDPPAQAPAVILTAPTGAVWEWNTENTSDVVQGSALDFARVVTQTRSFEDTSLQLKGDVAASWMRIAQCFAGPPIDPPKKGARYKV